MDCQRIQEMLSAMVDGEATPGEGSSAARHLARCPACRIAAARMATFTRRLRVRPATLCRDFAPVLLSSFSTHQASAPAAPLCVVTAGEQRRPENELRDAALRPCCVPAHAVVWGVGTAHCGCGAACGCGCQNGLACHCHASVA
jgi:anti-sigma factor RsiW